MQGVELSTNPDLDWFAMAFSGMRPTPSEAAEIESDKRKKEAKKENFGFSVRASPLILKPDKEY